MYTTTRTQSVVLQMVVNMGGAGCTQGGMEVLYLFGPQGGHVRNCAANAALHHKQGVLCIICTVAGSEAIRWFGSSSSDAKVIATASSESAQATAILHQVISFVVVLFLLSQFAQDGG